MALEPITRAEQIMSGESLTPITREEMFLAKAAGMDVVTPEPITRKEMFLSMIASGGGSGGGDEEWFNDGDTHIWITLQEGRTSPMLGVGVNGTVTVDWGDGTEPDVLTGTSVYTVQWTPTHNYAKPGDYVIRLTVEGEFGLNGNSGGYQYACILRHDSGADARNITYQSAINRIEIGSGLIYVSSYALIECYSLTNVVLPNGVKNIGVSTFQRCCSLKNIVIPDSVKSIGSGAFTDCYSLANVVFSDSLTSIDANAFRNCYSLKNIVIPDSLTSIGISAFGNCYSLTKIVIPDSVKSIGNGAFENCPCIFLYDFTKHTSVPTLGVNAFRYIEEYCEIRVPAALYDEWIAAENWSTYASQIVPVGTVEPEEPDNPVDKYSWEGVFASIDKGTYATDYAIGDMIPLDLGSEGLINMQIAAFDADDLADGSGKAPITWIAEKLLVTGNGMNPSLVTNDDGTYQEGTGAIGGWEKSELRTYLKETIKPLIPEVVRNSIKAVTKTHDAYDTAGEMFTQTSIEDVWLPDDNEMFGSSSPYMAMFPDSNSRKKARVGKTTTTYWWLRSAYNANNFHCVSSSGSKSENISHALESVIVCFCT